MITSGKGGVGKTTCCANVGRALAARGKKTVLVEGDVGLNNLDVALGVEDKIFCDAGEVAAGKATLRQSLFPVEKNLDLLPATSASAALLCAEFFLNVTEKLKKEYEYVLIDCPAGLEDGFHRSVVAAKEAILVTTPHLTSIRDGYKTIRVLSGYGIEKIGLVVNRVRGDYVLRQETLSPREISESMKVPLCGAIPECEDIDMGDLVDLSVKNEAGYAFILLAAYIDGGERKIYDCTAQYRGLKNRLRRWLS